MLKSLAEKINTIASSVESLKESNNQKDESTNSDKLNAIATTTDWLKGAMGANEQSIVSINDRVNANASNISALKTDTANTTLQLKAIASSIEVLKTKVETHEQKLSQIVAKLDLIHSDLLSKTNEILTKMNSLVTIAKPTK